MRKNFWTFQSNFQRRWKNSKWLVLESKGFIWHASVNKESRDGRKPSFSTIAIIEFHGIDRLLSNLRHNARAQSASVTRNKQGCAAYEVCIVTQSIGDSGQLAIKPESRCPVAEVDHVRWNYIST